MTLRHADATTTVTDLDDALNWLGDTPQDFLDALPDAQALQIRHAYNSHRLEAGDDLLSPDASLPTDAFDDFAPLEHIDATLPMVLDQLLDAGGNQFLRLPAVPDEDDSTQRFRLVRIGPEKRVRSDDVPRLYHQTSDREKIYSPSG